MLRAFENIISHHLYITTMLSFFIISLSVWSGPVIIALSLATYLLVGSGTFDKQREE